MQFFFSRPLALKYRVSSRRASMYICAPVSDRTGACLRAKREVARRGCEILKGSKKKKEWKMCRKRGGVEDRLFRAQAGVRALARPPSHTESVYIE